jgi:hypothetical protein
MMIVRVDEKSGAAVFNQLRQSSDTRSHNRHAGSPSL